MSRASRLCGLGVFALPRERLWPFLGLWTMHVWIYWFNTSGVAASAGVPGWLSIYGVMTLAMVCAAMVHWGVTAEREGGTLDAPLAILMCATTLSAQMCAWVEQPADVRMAWVSINVILAGVTMAWGYLRWAVVYARLAIRDAVGCLFASYLVGSSLKVVFDVVPTPVGTLMACALPLVSLMSTRRALADGWPRSEERRSDVLYRRGTLSTLCRLAVCVLVFCLVREMVSTTVEWGGSPLAARALSHLIEVVFAAAALWHVFGRGRSLDFPQLWRFVFLFLATAVLVECASAGLGMSLGLGSRLFSGVATSLVVMLLWLLLSDVAHHSDLHPVVVFGVGWSLYVGANYSGMLVARVLGLSSMTALLGLLLVYALGITMVFCLETRSPDVQRIFADMRRKVTPEEFATIDERCAKLASEHGLTTRELEVVRLLAKGRSKAFIAEELFISENTVRGHARRIYAKLDVHTKSELQDLLGI